MSNFLILFFSVLFVHLSSQSFTKGSVYDYSVGDTIVTYSANYPDAFSSAGPPTVTYRVFTNKYYSANMDTVFYKVYDVYTTPQPVPPYYPPKISAGNFSFFVTNLTSSAINFVLPGIQTCQTTIDTSYVNSCGLNEHFKYAKVGFGCFEPPTIRYKIVEGIGVFQDTRSLNGFPFPGGTKTDLYWFRKGNQRCGVAGAIPDGIKEWIASSEKLTVYPNPSSGQFIFESKEKGILSIQNVFCEEIYKVEIWPGKNSIELSDFVSGIYIAKCIAGNKIYTAKLVKE